MILNGILVGEFEEMYRDFSDPWEQTIHERDALDKSVGLALLKKYGHRRPLEYGCGLGHFTAHLHRELGAAAGLDISETAIAKAKRRYPGPLFFAGDILLAEPLLEFKPDALILAEITWYVLDRLPAFKALISRTFGGGGFLHILTTYPVGQQNYGAEHFTTADEIMSYWSDVIDILEWGQVMRKDGEGLSRSFFYGKVK